MAKQSQKQKKRQQKAAKKTSRPAKSIRLMGWVVAVLAGVLYINTLNHGYVLDDFSVIKENWVTQKGWDGISTIFKTSYRHGYWSSQGTLYRPISLAMFAAEWGMSPDNPTIHHFVNILVYVLIGLVLFQVLHKMLDRYNILLPFIISLLFIAHPIHTEVVANIKSRDELLSFLFSLLAIKLFLRHIDEEKRKYLFYSLGLYFLAFLSRESTITYLAIFPMVLYFFQNKSIKTSLVKSAVFVVPALIYLGIRKSVLGSIKGVEAVSFLDNLIVGAKTMGDKLATCFLIIGKYFKLLIFPHPLACDYSFAEMEVANWGNVGAIVGLALMLTIGAVAIWLFKKRHFISFAILFFLATFSIYSNIVLLIGSHMGDRFLFVPSLGFCMVVGFLLLKAFKIDMQNNQQMSELKFLFKKNKKVFAVAAVIIVLYGFKTIGRNKDWKSDFHLYSVDVNTSSNSARTHYYYGLELMKTKAVKEAKTEAEKTKFLDQSITEFQKAIEIYPRYADAWDQQGLGWYRKNNYEKAVECYNKALEYNPTKAITYSNLGAIYFHSKQYEMAMEVYQKAVYYDPHYADAWLNLGSTYATTGKINEAINAYQKGLEYEPNNAQINYFLGITYQNTGDKQNANYYLNRAYQLNPLLKK